jgi:hypothetical protein
LGVQLPLPPEDIGQDWVIDEVETRYRDEEEPLNMNTEAALGAMVQTLGGVKIPIG